ncbi:substrate-binding domain-containing protein [Jatrophihabitans telluris]|uniref:Substrate-binding domain-containing protein n=1 Tax=Jatrophihabitans telluris TaxID=2038343 RepID=A0ABY4QYX1_9ACTN|nr:substrate-binding domain-containing protein [Jatrophihabitans telluris]UQX88402.1 substrate-binding domain-containing protein [Jatrophihabitans telluris]
MQKATIVKTGLAGAIALAVSLGVVSPAHADVQPQPNDAVAVGSDTVQYVGDFAADGDFNSNIGYNFTNNGRRLFSFDATADANGRAAYNSAGASLGPTIVLRAGSKPVSRPNGSGAGITALLNDTAHSIDFVRSSRLPSTTEESTATNNAAIGGLHVFQIATDGLQIAVAHASTHVPAGLSAAELVKIYNGTYKKWSDVPGYSGAFGSDGIVPVIPQTGSGTRNDFLNDLAVANGNTAITLGANVRTAEEHDPTGVTGVASGTDVNGNPISSADALSPFSSGRDKLIDFGYFGSSPAPNTIDLLTGTAPDTGTAYLLNRKLYLVARQTDYTSTTGFQAGSSVNKVKALFGTASSWFARGSNAALYTSAGVTQAWADLGVNP